MTKKPQKPTKSRRPREKKGLRLVSVRLDPVEHDVLRREAMRVAVAAGSLRPDVSALIRSAIKEWLAKNKVR